MVPKEALPEDGENAKVADAGRQLVALNPPLHRLAVSSLLVEAASAMIKAGQDLLLQEGVTCLLLAVLHKTLPEMVRTSAIRVLPHRKLLATASTGPVPSGELSSKCAQHGVRWRMAIDFSTWVWCGLDVRCMRGSIARFSVTHGWWVR